jgi:hypothetical protein
MHDMQPANLSMDAQWTNSVVRMVQQANVLNATRVFSSTKLKPVNVSYFINIAMTWARRYVRVKMGVSAVCIINDLHT